MNVHRNQQKKDLVLKMIKELVTLQTQVPKEAAKKLDYLLKGFLHDALDFEQGLYYINNNLMESRTIPMKIFWAQVVKIVRKYFDEAKKLSL